MVNFYHYLKEENITFGFGIFRKNIKSRKNTMTYGYMYSHVDKKGKIIDDIYCLGNGYGSEDGEFRRNLLTNEELENEFKMVKKEYPKMEEYVVQKLNKGEYDLTIQTYTNIDLTETEIEEHVAKTRINIKIYVYSIMIYLANEKKGLTDLHMNDYYKTLLTSLEDKMYFDKNYEKDYEKFIKREFMRESVDYGTDITYNGQKLIPITNGAANNILDLNNYVWREFIINHVLRRQRLRIVPKLYNCFIVEPHNISLYDNPASIDKFNNSDITTDLLHDMEVHNVKLDHIDNSNMRIFELKEHLSIPVKFMRNEIMLSEKTLFMAFRYRGKTINNVMEITKNGAYSDVFGDLHGKDYKHLILSILFNVYYLAKSKFVVQGDLHLNNVCVNTLSNVTRVYNFKDKYIKMKNLKSCAITIDFSRGFILPPRIAKLFNDKIFDNEKFKEEHDEIDFDTFSRYMDKSMESYIEYQSNRIVNRYTLHFESGMDLKPKILELLNKNDLYLFTLLSLMDFYQILKALTNKFKDKGLHIDNVILSNKVLEDVNHYLTVYLRNNIDNLDNSKVEDVFVDIAEKITGEKMEDVNKYKSNKDDKLFIIDDKKFKSIDNIIESKKPEDMTTFEEDILMLLNKFEIPW